MTIIEMKTKEYLSLAELPFPSSDDMQLQLIADLVSSPDMIIEARKSLSANMFSVPDCANAWSIICEMDDSHQTWDITSLRTKINPSFIAEKIVPRMAEETGSGYTTATHIEILKKLYTRQCIYIACLRTLKTASMENEADYSDVLLAIEQPELLELGTRPDEVSISTIANTLAEEIQEEITARQSGTSTRISSTIPSLDTVTYGGFAPGQLVSIGARPGVGKTALSLAIARNAAASLKHSLFFSLEMSQNEIYKRLLLSTGLIEPRELNGIETEWSHYESAVASLGNIPLYIFSCINDIDKIVSIIRTYKRMGKCNFVVIDYIGLVSNTYLPRNTNKADEIEEYTRRLKNLAQLLRIPILILSRLNREGLKGGKSPQLDSFRSSGAIEQDVDTAVLLEAETTQPLPGSDEPQKTGNILAWLRKDRHAKAKDVFFRLQPERAYTCFREISSTYSASQHVDSNG